MSDTSDTGGTFNQSTTPQPVSPLPDARAFQDQFDESLEDVLDITRWRAGRHPAEEYERLAREIQEAVERETAYEGCIRSKVFPLIVASATAPKGAGVYQATAK